MSATKFHTHTQQAKLYPFRKQGTEHPHACSDVITFSRYHVTLMQECQHTNQISRDPNASMPTYKPDITWSSRKHANIQTRYHVTLMQACQHTNQIPRDPRASMPTYKPDITWPSCKHANIQTRYHVTLTQACQHTNQISRDPHASMPTYKPYITWLSCKHANIQTRYHVTLMQACQHTNHNFTATFSEATAHSDVRTCGISDYRSIK